MVYRISVLGMLLSSVVMLFRHEDLVTTDVQWNFVFCRNILIHARQMVHFHIITLFKHPSNYLYQVHDLIPIFYNPLPEDGKDKRQLDL